MTAADRINDRLQLAATREQGQAVLVGVRADVLRSVMDLNHLDDDGLGAMAMRTALLDDRFAGERMDLARHAITAAAEAASAAQRALREAMAGGRQAGLGLREVADVASGAGFKVSHATVAEWTR